MNNKLKNPPLTEKQLIKLFHSKYKIASSKIITELISYKGYDRVVNIYLLMQKILSEKKINEKITGRKINDMYTFDKHFRNSLKEKLEIIEIFFANKLISYIALEANKLCKNKNEYYLTYLFSEEIFEDKFQAMRQFQNTYKRKNKKARSVKKIEVWEYKDLFELGQLRTLYNLFKPKHKQKFIRYLNIGKINLKELTISLLTFNTLRNRLYHSEQIIDSKSFNLPEWIENKVLTPHEKIALFLISYTPLNFYNKILKPLLSHMGNKNNINYYDWKRVLKEKKQIIK